MSISVLNTDAGLSGKTIQTLAQIRSLVTSAVIAAAANLGVTVTASQVLLPALQQGA